MLLVELFNSSVPYKWESPYIAEFNLDDNQYFVSFSDRRGPTNIVFGIDKGGGTYIFSASGTGKEFLVFSTIVKIIKEYVAKHNPQKITFGSKGDSRTKLYSKLIQIFAKDFNVEHKEDEYDVTDSDFILTRKSSNN